jgi:hypothetical protein
MKNLKHIKLFENFGTSKKYLIELSSANSARVTEHPGEITRSEADRWSMGFPAKYDVTELCQRFGDNTNGRYAEIIAGLTDISKFNRDVEGYLKGSDFEMFTERNVKSFVRKMNQIYRNNYESVPELKDLEKKFKQLSIDDKIAFNTDLKELGFLIVRGSYIYKVVDESEIGNLLMRVNDRLDTL